jgi:hypothetical protein
LGQAIGNHGPNGPFHGNRSGLPSGYFAPRQIVLKRLEGDAHLNPEHIIPQTLLRLWPFPRGAGRICDRYFRDLTFQCEVATVRTTDGFSMKVRPNELIGRHIYLTGAFDRSTFEVLLMLAKPGDVLLDIGANIGYVSACFLQRVDQRIDGSRAAFRRSAAPALEMPLRSTLMVFC